jgi:hypothetical protein
MEITISSSPDHFLEQHFLDKAQAQGKPGKGEPEAGPRQGDDTTPSIP